MSETPVQQLTATLRKMAQDFASGDQVPPCAVLWPDPERLWESVVAEMRGETPELYTLGSYQPENRTGPALWLRCLEARLVEGAPPAGTTPIFYLPGVGKDLLKNLEECPPAILPLVELQFRGVTWLHVNGREWTPYAFAVTPYNGLSLDMDRSQGTLDALAGALTVFMREPLTRLMGRRLDAEFLNGLVSPDATGLLLRWLSASEVFRQQSSPAQWRAFCQQCRSDLRFDPEKDGPLKAAQLLAARGKGWDKAWQRFCEAPDKYLGIVEWLRRAAPRELSIFESCETWPHANERAEKEVREELISLATRPQAEAAKRVLDLEETHGERRRHPWRKLGLSPLAVSLEPLAHLANLCLNAPGAPHPESFAERYAADGWQVDAAALAAMASCASPELQSVGLGVVRALYLPWLENTSRHLQALLRQAGGTMAKKNPVPPLVPGRVLLFADGLRMDIAHHLKKRLEGEFATTLQWEWSTIPSVTATAKPATSPLAGVVRGGEVCDEFTTELSSNGQRMTQDRFLAALRERGWQCLAKDDLGDPTGSAWTECGTLDKRGHNEGWKLALNIEAELQELAHRIKALIQAGWKEVLVVTDHGWLLMPGGLPKVELKNFLADHRWGRCAALKEGVAPEPDQFRWHWNPAVGISSPPGVGSYRAGLEYTHGGVSLQEMVIPQLRVVGSVSNVATLRLSEIIWKNATCRVLVAGSQAGIKVDVRSRFSDSGTSLLSDGQARETTPEGKVTLFLENDADIGREAFVVLLDSSGQVVDSQPTKLGGLNS